MASKILSVLSLAVAVSAHGRVTSPPARGPGPAFQAACGSAMANNMGADPNGNIQGLEQMRDSTLDRADCFLPLCKAFPFSDNEANVQAYAAGETIPFEVEIAAPHTGVANVSIVNTATNSILGAPLIEFTNYASTATGVAANNTAFSVTLPDSIAGADCSVAGNCVLQWWWDSDEASQTYMSCIDFTFGGSTGGGGDDDDESAPPPPAPPAEEESSAPVSPPPAATATPVESGAPAPSFSTIVPDATPTAAPTPPSNPPQVCTRRRVRRNSPEAKRFHAKRAAQAAAAARR